MDDFDDILTSGQVRINFLTLHPFLDLCGKFLDNLEIDICFQKGQPHVPQGFLKVLLRNGLLAANLLDGCRQFIGQHFKSHGVPAFCLAVGPLGPLPTYVV